MTRKFTTPDYATMLQSTVSIGEALPKEHLARFVVDVIKQPDLAPIYRRYAPVGGEAIAPEILLGLLFYGYATGAFSSRKIERAAYESLPFRFIASGLHPDHDTVATFRKTFLLEIQELFVQGLAVSAVDQEQLIIVAVSLAAHPNDTAEAEPTLAALPAEWGTPPGAALDNGYWSEPNRQAFERRQIEAYIATGREPHHQSWEAFFAEQAAPPPTDASPKEQMAYKLQTEMGRAVYRLRKCTVEPVIGIIKEVLGFRQFSLRGLRAALGEWCLVCLAFNLKRLHVVWPA